VCMCAWSAPSAPQDLLLLVYKCVQSVKLLLLRVRQSFAKVASTKTLQANGSAGVSQDFRFWLSVRRGFLLDKKRERKEGEKNERVLLTIEIKPTCTVNFFNDSIQVARQTRIQIVIYLFVDVFLFYN